MSWADEVHFLIMGGTIDGVWSKGEDGVVLRKLSVIPEYIRDLGLPVRTNFSQVCIKDSTEITEEDRKILALAIKDSLASYIVVTHGSRTAPDTAKFLQDTVLAMRHDQIIIVMSADTPLGIPQSDAPFWLGYVMAFLQLLKPGVYVCTNKAQILTPDEAIAQKPS